VVTPLIRICVTGPESTGKTTLARRLAESIGTEWVPEGSRLYAERVGRPLLASDVSPIAREHVTLAEEGAARARERGASALVLDTDLLSTVIYARHYYDAVPAWIEDAERARRADLYLLCDVDVPWIPDGVRDRPVDRAAMFQRFHHALTQRGAGLVVIRGDWAARWALARSSVDECLTAAARRV
jgi:NadR type nicotinamide-nucleotide adenylyltransferase